MTKRKRTYNVRLIKATWPYSVQEIAELFGLHKNAVLRWLREGLTVDRQQRPFLIRGDDLARFLTARQTARRRKCAETEFFCFKCHVPRPAFLGIADIVMESPTRMRVTALCAICSTPVNKMQAPRNLPKIRSNFEIQQMSGEHLADCTERSLNSDSTRKD